MPFLKPVESKRIRILINGDVYSGKTHSLMSFPAPRMILSLPGEEGYGTLPQHDPETTVLVWGAGKQINESSLNVINEVERETYKALQTPGLQTLALEGLHKFAPYVMDAMSGGAYFEGLKVKTESRGDDQVLDPRVWGQTERWLASYLNTVRQSTVPFVVVTAWDGDRQERKTRQGEKWTDVPTKKMPALPRATSRTIVGEFTITVHASHGSLTPGGEKVYRWQTQPDGVVLAAGLKVPPEVRAKVPKFVKAEWGELAKYLAMPQGVGQNGQKEAQS